MFEYLMALIWISIKQRSVQSDDSKFWAFLEIMQAIKLIDGVAGTYNKNSTTPFYRMDNLKVE